MNKQLIVIDDEDSICLAFKRFFERRGWQVQTCATGQAGMDACLNSEPDLVFLDVRLPDIDGLQVLDQLMAKKPQLQVVVISAYGSLETVTQAVKGKAFDYLAKPIDLDRAVELAERAVEQAREEEDGPAAEKPSGSRIIGTSHIMQEVYKRIGLVAQTDSSVLIMGETGTGKELVARAIHEHSARQGEPFVAVNCGALPENLIESELFGYEKGAFTGADQPRAGRFEAANGGTLFLDEVGELPLPMQVKLLRVLDDQIVERLGSQKPIPLNVRILAATNRQLVDEVSDGRFRSDLFYRLNVIHIALPPVHDRREDIPQLARHFLALLSQGKTPAISRQAMGILRSHPWPGNVRELRNAMEHAIVVAGGARILPEHLPASVRDQSGVAAKDKSGDDLIRRYVRELGDAQEDLYKMAIEPLERILLETALSRCGGNQSVAAGILGIHRNTMRNKIRALKIDPKAVRPSWP